MGDLTAERTPYLIAAEINTIKDQTGKILLYSAMEIGRRLKEAKDLIDHGEWLKWLEESVCYSQRTASNLMRLFEEYEPQQLVPSNRQALADLKGQRLADLNYTQALILLGVPEEDRAQFIAELDIESLSTRELQKAVQGWNQAAMERDRTEQENAGLQKTIEDQESRIKELTQERDGLKTKTEQLNKSQAEAAAKAERLSMELESHKQDTTAKAMDRMSRNLNAAYHRAQANRIVFLYENMERNLKELKNELKAFKDKDLDTYEVYRSKVVNFLTQSLKERDL